MTEKKLLKSDYYYDLPPELIAQDPLLKRDNSRLMVLDKRTGKFSHRFFYEIGEFLQEGDCLVLNDTKVIPARLLGVKEDTGAAVEILLLKNRGNDIWEAIVKPGKKLKEGVTVSFGEGLLKAVITEVLQDGNRLVKFFYDGIWEELLDRLGLMPLPPYITHKLKEKDRYQTVYARYDGSAAAPTAGLHFTKELLDDLSKKGIRQAFVTLHVGLGTFRPVKAENILEHHMHTEFCRISEEAAGLINETKRAGKRVICVGTTSCRTIESAAKAGSDLSSCEMDTDIFIYPGYEFKLTDGLITNFHLPESTLLMLVSALAGRENILNAYRAAIGEKYRFFSFGDAMLII